MEGYLECFFKYPCDFDTCEIVAFEAFKVVAIPFHCSMWPDDLLRVYLAEKRKYMEMFCWM